MEGNKTLCANLINGELKTLIHDTIKNKFGVETDIVATPFERFINIKDNDDDVDKKMRGNKLLRSVFKSAELVGDAWMEEETGIIRINLRIAYVHPNGGSNGRELGRLVIYTTKNKAKILP